MTRNQLNPHLMSHFQVHEYLYVLYLDHLPVCTQKLYCHSDVMLFGIQMGWLKRDKNICIETKVTVQEVKGE
jgi:hypothetical protein